jgi:outer membrane protein
MNRNLVLTLAVAAGLASSSLSAQTAPAAPAAAPAPQAIPAKIAVIAFEQVVVATNEGQRATADIQKKYEPKKTDIDNRAAEIESLKKQLQALPATTSDEERANRLKAIDTKEKALQRDAEDASTNFQNDMQEAYGKVAQKVGSTAVKYAQDNGFTILLNVGGQQQANPILWEDAKTDISQAVVNEYNKVSGVAPPPPAAPAARKPAAPSK